VITHPEQAKALLVAHPQLAYALFQALLLAKIVDPAILQVTKTPTPAPLSTTDRTPANASSHHPAPAPHRARLAPRPAPAPTPATAPTASSVPAPPAGPATANPDGPPLREHVPRARPCAGGADTAELLSDAGCFCCPTAAVGGECEYRSVSEGALSLFSAIVC
jgi:cleavage stimulation factor subunit 2